jgi:uncharacterized repeat protein (TIGR02543 family)
MKNRIIGIVLAGLALCLAVTLAGCENPTGGGSRHYTITFDADGGTFKGEETSETREVASGAAVGENMPDDPAKEGAAFDGWYTEEAGGGDEFTADTEVTEDITVYAKWISIPCIVSFDVNGGDGPTPDPVTVDYGATLGDDMPTDPARTGYTFGGWYTEQSVSGSVFTASTPVIANITVYAKWIADPRTVMFDVNGGDDPNPDPVTVNYGATLGENMPTNPTRTNYTFGGWYTEEAGGGEEFTADTEVTEDITVYAKWTIISYTVTFNGSGGEPATQTRIVESSSAVGTGNMPANPIRTGYTFGGWYTTEDGGGDEFTSSTPVSVDITVYAKWTPIICTVSFNVNGGTGPNPDPVTVNYGATVGAGNMPTVTNGSRYDFNGWWTMAEGGEQFTGDTPVTADITVYAKWIRNAFIDLAFTPEDASGAGWTYNSASGVYTILDGAEVTVTGATTERRIVVASGAAAALTLQDASIDVSGHAACAFDTAGAVVNLILAGDNKLKGGEEAAALHTPQGATLTITGSGSLDVSGGKGGAGIGGGKDENGGVITINGGVIDATGGGASTDYYRGGAGIGGGKGGSGGNITITGGTVTASGSYHNDYSPSAAGIGGGGDGSSGGVISISGGVVTANGSPYAAGIGGGNYGSAGNISISGGVVSANGGTGCPGIGSGSEGSGGAVVISGGVVSAAKNTANYDIDGTVTIKGGSVKALDVAGPPTNGSGASVYLNTLTVGAAPVSNTAITAGGIDNTPCTQDGVNGYGIKDVKTDADGKVYFWLPANDSGSVSLTAGGGNYSKTYQRTASGNTETLN